MAFPIINTLAAIGIFYYAFTSGSMDRPPLEDQVKKAGSPVEQTIQTLDEIPESHFLKP